MPFGFSVLCAACHDVNGPATKRKNCLLQVEAIGRDSCGVVSVIQYIIFAFVTMRDFVTRQCGVWDVS